MSTCPTGASKSISPKAIWIGIRGIYDPYIISYQSDFDNLIEKLVQYEFLSFDRELLEYDLSLFKIKFEIGLQVKSLNWVASKVG